MDVLVCRKKGWGDISSFFFLQRKANSAIEQQKRKGHEKRDHLLVAKVEFNLHISQWKKIIC